MKKLLRRHLKEKISNLFATTKERRQKCLIFLSNRSKQSVLRIVIKKRTKTFEHKGEIVPEENENILEFRIAHDAKTWD